MTHEEKFRELLKATPVLLIDRMSPALQNEELILKYADEVRVWNARVRALLDEKDIVVDTSAAACERACGQLLEDAVCAINSTAAALISALCAERDKAVAKVDHLRFRLDERDQFLVNNHQWSAFVDSLAKPEGEGR